MDLLVMCFFPLTYLLLSPRVSKSLLGNTRLKPREERFGSGLYLVRESMHAWDGTSMWGWHQGATRGAGGRGQGVLF